MLREDPFFTGLTRTRQASLSDGNGRLPHCFISQVLKRERLSLFPGMQRIILSPLGLIAGPGVERENRR